MATAWISRSQEEQSLLNPAFLGILVHQVADGFGRESGRALPFVLPFVALPIVLHAPTRTDLPRSVRTSLAAWVDAHPRVLLGFPHRASALTRHVREGILFASGVGALEVDTAGEIRPGNLNARWKSNMRRLPTDEVQSCAQAALFVGRWFALAGPEATILTLWGVQP